MTKAYLTLLLIILIDLTLLGQVKNSKLIEEKVKYQYDDKKPSESYVPKVELGKEIQINFDCCFDDTVQIFVNDKLIEKVFLKTDESTSFTGHSIKVKFDEKEKSTTLKVVLPNKQVYCNIILDKKYRMLNVNRMEHWAKTWWITFRNFGIFYE
jgi:predicted DNA-binding ArsR family transcriptional regulator